MGRLGGAPDQRRSIWPHVEEKVLDLIQAHKSTIVFANSRRLAERLCGRLNELAAERAELEAGAGRRGGGRSGGGAVRGRSWRGRSGVAAWRGAWRGRSWRGRAWRGR